MGIIQKARREWFGGIVFTENTDTLALIDSFSADRIGLPRLAHYPTGVFSAPVEVHLALTTRCSHPCPGCYAHKVGEEGCDLPFEMACHIAERLAVLDVFTVLLSGGEPLLYSQLFELADFLRQRNIAPALSTNGQLLDADAVKKCTVFSSIRLGCHTLRDLEHLEPAINLLIRGGIRPSLNLLVSRENFGSLPAIFSLAARRGIQKVFLNLFKLTNKNATASAMQLTQEKQRELYPTLVSLARRFKVTPVFDCATFPAIAFGKPREREWRQFNIHGCSGGNMTLAIDVNGNIRPCPFWPEHFGPAEALTEDFWLNHPLLQFFRGGSACEACTTCDYLEPCAKGCRLYERQACGATARSLLKIEAPLN